MKFRYTFKGLFIFITIVAFLAMYLGYLERRGDEDARFNRAMILVHSVVLLIAYEYGSDAKVPGNVDLRFLLNKYNGEQNTGPVKDPWGKVLHVKIFNNGTLAMVYSDGEDRIDNQGQQDDLSALVCLIHEGPWDCNCSSSNPHKHVAHFSRTFAKVNQGSAKGNQAKAAGQNAGP